MSEQNVTFDQYGRQITVRWFAIDAYGQFLLQLLVDDKVRFEAYFTDRSGTEDASS